MSNKVCEGKMTIERDHCSSAVYLGQSGSNEILISGQI